MMDRVSRKDHRYVVLTKNDLIASKTFFKNFLPPTRGLRGNNPLSQFSSIFPCTVRGTKQPSWNSFLEETKKQPPRFFFTRSSSSYTYSPRNDNSTELFDEISLNLNSTIRNSSLELGYLFTRPNYLFETIRFVTVARRNFARISRVWRRHEPWAATTTRNVPSTPGEDCSPDTATPTLIVEPLDWSAAAARTVLSRQRLRRRAFSRPRYLRLDLEHRLQSTCLQRSRNVG